MQLVKSGNCRAIQRDSNKQKIPLKITVVGAPICCARVPATKLPKGNVPITASEYKLITLPHLSSSTKVWTIVLPQDTLRIPFWGKLGNLVLMSAQGTAESVQI